MPHARKDELPIAIDQPVISTRYAELGSYTVAFQTFPADFDASALFRGLPDDRCQCPHWGIVLSGELIVQYGDRVETFRAGDAYYIEPGHVPRPRGGTELVEFSPTADLVATNEVADANSATPHMTLGVVGIDATREDARL